MLDAIPRTTSAAWIVAGVIAVAGLVFIPLELLAIAAGALLDVPRGAFVALLGSLLGAAIGYAIGLAIGVTGLPRWMSRRSYRSARQLGARGVMGVTALRLASVATSGSIHLLCGAGRVPFATFMTGTLLAFVIVCAAVLIMRKTHPEAHRPFRAPLGPIVPILGIFSCLILMFSLPPENWVRLAVWLVIGLTIYFTYSRKHSAVARALGLLT